MASLKAAYSPNQKHFYSAAWLSLGGGDRLHVLHIRRVWFLSPRPSFHNFSIAKIIRPFDEFILRSSGSCVSPEYFGMINFDESLQVDMPQFTTLLLILEVIEETAFETVS